VFARFLREKAGQEFLDTLDPMTVGLGKGAAVVLFVYFALKWIGVAHDDHWGLLATSQGSWFLAELLLFVLAPGILLAVGAKKHSARVVRVGAFWAIAGVILNRLNVSLVMFNWHLPGHLHHLVPPVREAGIVLAVAMIHIILFRWIVNRMPVLREHPDYHDDHG